MNIEIKTQAGGYPIILERGSLGALSKYIRLRPGARAVIVTDDGVPERHVSAAAQQFDCHVHVFPQGEKNKCFNTYIEICRALLSASLTRGDAVIAVGGGVCGDMAGFAAATYMRGVDFYNVPTTLLSQVDSSIGGKTGIDLDGVKNIVGAFYQPKAVVIDPNVLSTLSGRHLSNGAAESIKAGVLCDRELFEMFEKNSWRENIDEVIRRSLLVKRQIVQQDERESGVRRALNLGHTLGHAIEGSASDRLLHGECVAVGMLPMCGEKIRPRVKAAIENAGLCSRLEYSAEAAADFLRHDKKAVSSEKVCVVKSDEIGSFYFQSMTQNELCSLL